MEDVFKSTKNETGIFRPLFFRLIDETAILSLKMLLKSHPHTFIINEIESQVKELVEARNPSGLEPGEVDQKVIEILSQGSHDSYGVWVYYPWAMKLVHILDESEFIELRTNRNQNKITRQEQETLAKKKIGIVGLSVGQSIALTLAMERGCGELRLADFDIIELSNLNRIRTPLYNLGVPKVIATAREICEIDPFIQVKIFEKGITPSNMMAFMLADGKLDILVDECDSLDIKIQAREFARQHKIPVIMDTSDRGMMDVERFDLEPDRPIFHGRVAGINSENLKGLSDADKIPVVLQILGFEKLSPRAKSSLSEVKKTIKTWPQLATSVILGGAIGADVSRRILLNDFHDSGRYYVDIEGIIKDIN